MVVLTAAWKVACSVRRRAERTAEQKVARWGPLLVAQRAALSAEWRVESKAELLVDSKAAKSAHRLVEWLAGRWVVLMAVLLEDSRAVPTAAQRAAWWAVSKAARRV